MGTSRTTILVVEDHAAIRRIIGRALRHKGFRALHAASAEAGLAVIEAYEGSIDLAIIDIVMSGMSGLDLAAELIRERPLVKILYISGYADSVAMQTLARIAPESVLAKPFTPSTLMERVEYLLNRNVARAPQSDGEGF